MKRLLFLVVFTLIAVPSGQAQALQLEAGSTIRLAAVDGSFGEYKLIQVVADTLVLRDARAGQMRVGTSDLTELSVRRTRSDTGRNAVIGLGVGAVLGVALGLIEGGPEGSMFPASEMAPGLGLVFGAAGMSLGALIGLATSESRWEPVILPLSQKFDVAGARVGLSYRLVPTGTATFP